MTDEEIEDTLQTYGMGIGDESDAMNELFRSWMHRGVKPVAFGPDDLRVLQEWVASKTKPCPPSDNSQ